MLSALLFLFQDSPGAEVWSLPNILAFVSIVVALISALLAYWPIYQQSRTQRLLEKNFGADYYDVSTIERATHYYVRPYCSSVDPAQEAEIRNVIATQEDLFVVVDKYLSADLAYRHILLLADSGMGKSSFVLNYYVYNQRKPKGKRHRLALVPLGIPNALEEIMKIDNKKQTIIFLDAFDEDTKAIQDHRSRLMELMHACHQFKRVLITCRTQFFPKDEEIPRETGIVRVGPRKPGEPGFYEFWKLYLSPLDDRQVKEFLHRRYPFRHYFFKASAKRNAAQKLVNKIPLLSARPMLLSYIPDVIESDTEIEKAYQLYEVMVERWLERERHWVDKEDLRAFSERLAVDLYKNREERLMERIDRKDLLNMIKSYNISIDEWKITGRSLLNRDAQGNYKFAHRSIMEYFFVVQLLKGDGDCYGVTLTDQMKLFLFEISGIEGMALFDVFMSAEIIVDVIHDASNLMGNIFYQQHINILINKYMDYRNTPTNSSRENMSQNYIGSSRIHMVKGDKIYVFDFKQELVDYLLGGEAKHFENLRDFVMKFGVFEFIELYICCFGMKLKIKPVSEGLSRFILEYRRPSN